MNQNINKGVPSEPTKKSAFVISDLSTGCQWTAVGGFATAVGGEPTAVGG